MINRDGNDLEELLVKYDKYKDNIIISNMEMKDISSTYIRDNIKEIDKVKEYIDEDVLRYIQENNLHGDDSTVYISVYDSLNDKHYDSVIKAIKSNRKDNKDLVIEEVIKILLEIL